MRYGTLIIALCITGRAAADQAANGPNGVNARVTGLTGANVPIGQVESGRSGKAGYDNDSNSASNTSPSSVLFQTAGGQDSADSPNIYSVQFGAPHATGVANVMIGQSTSFTGRTAVSYPTYAGVAPGAFLVSTASGAYDEVDLVESLNRTALQFSGDVRAINISLAIPLSFPETPNGHSYLSLFLDWSARQHDVLYVPIWGNDGQAGIRSPADIFNGLVVGASAQPGENVWRKFANVNSTDGLGGNTFDETMHIDLLAPGKNIHVLETNDIATTNAEGTSYAAPLVTGSVALLTEFIRQPGHTGNFTNATKHQVIKAVMMNSADKISGVHGSFRTAIDSNNQDWLQSEATFSQIALDDQLRLLGWRVLIVWECELSNIAKLERRVSRFMEGSA